MSVVQEIMKGLSKGSVLETPELESRVLDLYSDIKGYPKEVDDKKVSLTIDDLTEEEVLLAIEMDMAMMPMEITVSAGETRQMKQYSPNVYHCSMKMDCGTMYTSLLSHLAGLPAEDRLRAYVDGKRLLYASIANKYSTNEDFQRNIIHKQQEADGITPF